MERDQLRFYTSYNASPDSIKASTERTKDQFRDDLIQIAKQFPTFDESQNEQQKHITFFIHGYNNSWNAAAKRYLQIQPDLYLQGGLGQLILFTWPSDHSTAHYLPYHEDPPPTALARAQVFVDLLTALLPSQ